MELPLPVFDHFDERRLPRIALTIGDVNGIGPEVMLKALARPEVHDLCRARIIGSRQLLAAYTHVIPCGPVEHAVDGIAAGGRIVPVHDILSDATLAPGQIDARAGRLAGEAIQKGAEMAATGDVDALVTMPISKKSLAAGGFDFPGHTEMLASIAPGRPLMVLLAGSMRVAVATIHVPLSAVAPSITWTLVDQSIRDLQLSLRRDFGIDRPRVAVLGLNPHAGEHGLIGREETEIIGPTVDRLMAEGLDVVGPLPADGFFARYIPGEYDGILAMYHDQGLIPVKMVARGAGVNFTAGLPIVRTSPDHGTGFSIAGLGIAEEASVVEAIRVAASIVHQRRRATER